MDSVGDSVLLKLHDGASTGNSCLFLFPNSCLFLPNSFLLPGDLPRCRDPPTLPLASADCWSELEGFSQGPFPAAITVPGFLYCETSPPQAPPPAVGGGLELELAAGQEPRCGQVVQGIAKEPRLVQSEGAKGAAAAASWTCGSLLSGPQQHREPPPLLQGAGTAGATAAAYEAGLFNAIDPAPAFAVPSRSHG